MNAIATIEPERVATSLGRHCALVPTSMAEAMRLAEIMARAKLIPDHLRDAGDCLMVVMQAQRWGLDPFAVAQCTSIVHGRLCYEGKLVAAAMYATGAVDGRLRYEFSGTGAGRTVKVTGRPHGSTFDQEVVGSVLDWQTSNDNWKKIPDDMLVYRGTRQWARRYAPQAMLGVNTPDEVEDAPAAVTVTVQPEPVTLPAYPEDQFSANLAKWLGVIASGRRTAEDIIAMVESKGTLTDAQKAQIRGKAVVVGAQEAAA